MVCVCVCMCVCAHACMCVCVCMCVRVHVCMWFPSTLASFLQHVYTSFSAVLAAEPPDGYFPLVQVATGHVML